MVIAVNGIFLQHDLMEGYGHYANAILLRLAAAHSNHQFVIIFDRPFNNQFEGLDNITCIIVKPSARHIPAYLYWYNISSVLTLKKFKPDVWIQPYGFCSLTSSIPQILVVHDLAFHVFPKSIAWYHRWFYKIFTPLFLDKAKSLVTVSAFSKNTIEQNYPFTKNRIKTIPGAARTAFNPINWEEKLAIKNEFTNGNEYFICVGGIHPRKNMMNLLKAFSLFKKWNKSNMKLVFTGRLAWKYQDFIEKLKTYKYRDDIVLTGYLPEEKLIQITAAAYASLYISLYEGFGLPIVEAMQSGVPVVTSNNSSMPEVGGDAVLYADPTNPKTIAEQMQILYKDEKLRQFQIEKGLARAKNYNWEQSAASFWREVEALVTVS
jgi:glycosyltransferase involved in cell wall biosynthesis